MIHIFIYFLNTNARNSVVFCWIMKEFLKHGLNSRKLRIDRPIEKAIETLVVTVSTSGEAWHYALSSSFHCVSLVIHYVWVSCSASRIMGRDGNRSVSGKVIIMKNEESNLLERNKSGDKWRDGWMTCWMEGWMKGDRLSEKDKRDGRIRQESSRRVCWSTPLHVADKKKERER